VNRRALLAEATRELREAAVPSPEYDAQELLGHVLGLTRAALVTVDAVSESQAREFLDLVARRAARTPLQHLTGVAHFRHTCLQVGPGVFVPRPETELLAGWAIDSARASYESVARATDSYDVASRVRVVDLCTGSGAIAKSIAEEVAGAEVHAVELGEDAHVWATRNLAGSGVDLRHGDMAGAFADLDGTVDVVVCNPPYIPLEAWESVAVEARDHDPDLALFSGQDGLDAIRVLERTAARLLRPGGVVGFEHADAQGETAPAVFSGTGRWADVRDHLDLAGRPRFTTARLAR